MLWALVGGVVALFVVVMVGWVVAGSERVGTARPAPSPSARRATQALPAEGEGTEVSIDLADLPVERD